MLAIPGTWGTTDNGEWLFWRILPGQHLDQYTILVNAARGEDWEHYEMTFTGFLTGTLTGQIRSDILWSKFPTDPHDFHIRGEKNIRRGGRPLSNAA